MRGVSLPLPAKASALALSPDGRTVYLGGEDGTIRAVDITADEIRFSLAGHHDIVFGPGGSGWRPALPLSQPGRLLLGLGTWRAPPRSLPDDLWVGADSFAAECRAH